MYISSAKTTVSICTKGQHTGKRVFKVFICIADAEQRSDGAAIAPARTQASGSREQMVQQKMVSADLAKPHFLTDWSGISLLSLCCQTASHLLLSQLITVSGWSSAAPGTVSSHLIIFKKNLTLLPSKEKVSSERNQSVRVQTFGEESHRRKITSHYWN